MLASSSTKRPGWVQSVSYPQNKDTMMLFLDSSYIWQDKKLLWLARAKLKARHLNSHNEDKGFWNAHK